MLMQMHFQMKLCSPTSEKPHVGLFSVFQFFFLLKVLHLNFQGFGHKDSLYSLNIFSVDPVYGKLLINPIFAGSCAQIFSVSSRKKFGKPANFF